MPEKKTAAPRVRKTTARRTTTRAAAAVLPSEEEIRQRAYEIFLARGGRPGSPDQDWLQAERELNGADREE